MLLSLETHNGLQITGSYGLALPSWLAINVSMYYICYSPIICVTLFDVLRVYVFLSEKISQDPLE